VRAFVFDVLACCSLSTDFTLSSYLSIQSGRNDDYVLKLAAACRSLSTEVVDSHLFTLESLLLELRRREGMDMGMISTGDQKDVQNVASQPNAITA
jgi:hypothetical protein